MKLHLGCGPKHIPGWYHVDVVDLPHIELQHDVARLPMIRDNTVSVIYACHVVEHFMRREILDVLKEWHRVLQPGGTLRVAVPDFAAIVEEYHQTRNLLAVIGLLFGSQWGLYGFHHTVYDEPVLTDLLVSAGFCSIHRYDWQQTEHAWLDDFSQAYLPHMEKATGRLMSLNLEAEKPK